MPKEVGQLIFFLMILFFSPPFCSTDEHDTVQKKTFTKWINAQFSKVMRELQLLCTILGWWLSCLFVFQLPFSVHQSGKTPIKDMFSDLKDGRRLLDLLEGLTGSVLVRC